MINDIWATEGQPDLFQQKYMNGNYLLHQSLLAKISVLVLLTDKSIIQMPNSFMEQVSNVTEFILLGVIQNPDVQKLLFVIFSAIYFLTLVGNLLIAVTITTSPALGSLVYIFLFFLSLIDGCCSSPMAPPNDI
jgi:hypothetical protein